MGSTFVKTVRRLGFEVNSKSVVLANVPGLAEDISADFYDVDIVIGSARASEDLGVPASAGAGRPGHLQCARLDRAMVRSEGVQYLRRTNPGAAKLFSTGVLPQKEYAGESLGWPPAARLRFRRAAAT